MPQILTNRRANLHNELLGVMEAPAKLGLDAGSYLYAVAYRPLRREGKDEIDIWRSPLDLGKALPELPLGLSGDLAIAVHFETTYEEARRRRRLTAS